MMETKVYQGHIYQRSGPDQQWALVGPAKSGTGVVIADPYKGREQDRQDTQLDIQQGRLDQSGKNFAREASTTAITNPQTLRKEYAGLPEVAQYRVASQQARLALDTDASPQGDVTLTYAFAKAMDPASVVRDSENEMATGTQPWFQSAVENIKKQFGVNGSGNFTPATRNALRQEILRSLASRKTLYDARRAEMSDYAKSNSIDPYQVVGKSDTDLYAPAFRSFAEKNGDPGNVISSIIGGDPIKPAPNVPGGGNPPPLTAAPFGSAQGASRIPPEMQQEQQDYLAQHWGNIDPKDYVSFRINQDRKYGFSSDPDSYREDVNRFNDYAAKGVQPQQVPAIPDVPKPLSQFEQLRNDAVSNPVGAGVATALNSGGFGIPGLLAPDQMAALRQAHPVTTTIGDIAGGVGGAGMAGRGLRVGAEAISNPSVASLLAKPLAADLGYGAIYGGTTAKSEGRDPITGALLGGASGYLGNRVGSAIGRAFPKITGLGRDIEALDNSVPTSQQLKDKASQLYSDAEASGLTASSDDTLALADTTSGLLSKEGRLSPTGRLTEVQPKVKEAYSLIQDYAGQPMTPTQVQTVRGVIADGLSSKEPSEKRIARLLLGNFDDWTDTTNPDLAAGLSKARGVASRYLQGDKIAQARDLADVRAGQFSNSGQGNALRTDFRQLDRNIVKGNEQFPPGVESAIADVARGTPVSNALRFVGRFAPTGPVSALPTIAAVTGGGSAAGPLGAAGGAILGAGAYGARQLGQSLTERAAQVAENGAYGGQQWLDSLNALLDQAGRRGGGAGAGSLSAATTDAYDPIAALLSPQHVGY